MAYTSKNPKFDSTIFTDIGAGTPTNPAAGSHKLIDRSGTLFLRDSTGTEVSFGNTPATATTYGTVKGGVVPGQVSGSAVAAGYIGEILSTASVDNVTLSVGSYINITAPLSVTAGIWMLYGVVTDDGRGSGALGADFALSANSAAITGCTKGLDWIFQASNAGSSYIGATIVKYLNISSPTTYYLVGRANGSAHHIEATMFAVRIA